MKNLRIPVGISNFEKIRNGGFYYVDKTGLIVELIKSVSKVTLITRPRRFGKTLGMSMLENFFDIRKDSKKLFEGLEISNKHELCDEWMNQWPVVFLSLKSVDGLDFSSAYQQLVYEIGILYQEHEYLLESAEISEPDKRLFQQLRDRQAGQTDVMNYLLELQRNPEAKPISYWKNTSDNAIIRSFIDYAGSSITKKLEILMAGGTIVQYVDENLTYDYLHSSEDNLWSMLYLTGYLTKVRDEDYDGELSDGTVALMIPNAEVREIFETTVIKWFDDSAKKWNRDALFDAVWSGDSEKITKEMSTLLRRTISYHDYREDFYHAFLAGIFTDAGYMVDSNKEHGEGRSDVVVYDPVNGRVAVFEAKYTKVLEKLESECNMALKQIDANMYAKEYEDDYDQILCYGISFFKKRCMVKKK